MWGEYYWFESRCWPLSLGAISEIKAMQYHRNLMSNGHFTSLKWCSRALKVYTNAIVEKIASVCVCRKWWDVCSHSCSPTKVVFVFVLIRIWTTKLSEVCINIISYTFALEQFNPNTFEFGINCVLCQYYVNCGWVYFVCMLFIESRLLVAVQQPSMDFTVNNKYTKTWTLTVALE